MQNHHSGYSCPESSLVLFIILHKWTKINSNNKLILKYIKLWQIVLPGTSQHEILCINQYHWELMTALEKDKAKGNRQILFCIILRWMAASVDQKWSVRNVLFTIPDSERPLLFAGTHSFLLQNRSCSGSCTNWLYQKPFIQICYYWKPAPKLAEKWHSRVVSIHWVSNYLRIHHLKKHLC